MNLNFIKEHNSSAVRLRKRQYFDNALINSRTPDLFLLTVVAKKKKKKSYKNHEFQITMREKIQRSSES